MLSLFKKVRKIFTPEVCVIEEFIQKHGLRLSLQNAERHQVPHIPGQKIIKENKVITCRITEEQCKNLQENMPQEANLIEGESDQSYFGNIVHEGRLIGFYLGKSYHHEIYWARFWLE